MARRGLILLAALVLATACTGGDGDPEDRESSPARSETTTTTRPSGGVARVVVWQEPDPLADTITGAGVRGLVLPQLFRADPDGAWRPWLVEPGTVQEAPDLRSSSFRLREGALWSDGTPITGDDLRRGADELVEAVETAPDGRITLRFSQALPGWRGLWSGGAAVMPPSPSVWGGPYVFVDRIAGLEAVLEPNPRWWGDGPYLDRLELVLVPDDVTAQQLLERGEVDIVSPRPATQRTKLLDDIDGVRVLRGESTGWWFGARTDPSRVEPSHRTAMLSLIDAPTFVATLLDGEATVLEGFDSSVWAEPVGGDPAVLAGRSYDVVFADHDPVAWLIHRVMARSAEGARLEGRSADVEAVARFARERDYDVLLDWFVDDPDPCWRCRWGDEAPELALAADAGDPEAADEIQRFLHDEGLLLPLWRPVPVVAVRDGLEGPEPNGWARIPAWNAESWYRPNG